MKIKNVAIGFLVIGFMVASMSAVIASRPAGGMQQASVCQFDPVRCAAPQNLSRFPMFSK